MFTSRPFKVFFAFYLIAFNSTAGKLCFPSIIRTCHLEGIIHLSVCMCLYKIALGCLSTPGNTAGMEELLKT